ncbi:MAG: PIN domain-containing protein [Oscillospiraceae bacterium]|jgi:predicted nucleic acid-binding protein|nr:PIN domain-containing protein [Oscillospiraceae bacterium]
MTVLLDTNVIMDALQERQPFDTAAKEILLRAQNGEFACYFTANAATDIFYLYSKARGLESARQALNFLLMSYKIVSVTHEDCINAMSVPIEDFEDALVSTCAKKAEADCIISRDDKFLRGKSPVKVIEPKDFLKKLTGV